VKLSAIPQAVVRTMTAEIRSMEDRQRDKAFTHVFKAAKVISKALAKNTVIEAAGQLEGKRLKHNNAKSCIGESFTDNWWTERESEHLKHLENAKNEDLLGELTPAYEILKIAIQARDSIGTTFQSAQPEELMQQLMNILRDVDTYFLEILSNVVKVSWAEEIPFHHDCISFRNMQRVAETIEQQLEAQRDFFDIWPDMSVMQLVCSQRLADMPRIYPAREALNKHANAERIVTKLHQDWATDIIIETQGHNTFWVAMGFMANSKLPPQLLDIATQVALTCGPYGRQHEYMSNDPKKLENISLLNIPTIQRVIGLYANQVARSIKGFEKESANMSDGNREHEKNLLSHQATCILSLPEALQPTAVDFVENGDNKLNRYTKQDLSPLLFTQDTPERQEAGQRKMNKTMKQLKTFAEKHPTDLTYLGIGRGIGLAAANERTKVDPQGPMPMRFPEEMIRI